MARILLVEDNSELREILQQVMQLNGHEVMMARTGLHARDILEHGTFAPDAIVCDYRMPQMSGGELLAWVRAWPPCAGVFFILISGDNEDQERALTLGADAYLAKPFNLLVLDRMVTDHLRGRSPS
jgi:two-component system response regulator CpxR